ncbi:transaldolase family protein [Porcincola intestinalis]|uniref:transaldolase family protein n=1 Tax=Porcincola intestinalis TaxID=2606632 RepID=UPI0023F45BFE|nr:transaldolase family protein [Porcincola intestinalis]MCI6766447.1 fructose-6-phosphate aldolase [Lachnospiraceae bacterium]MDD7059565.1 transaldolase family protein [Porcincola intestinalis]MDY5283813.1 transaldolase family protein [Porcincola intestinalis]MDY5579283.1 transaldolase family protein [Porcincola intestinalis]
MRLIVDSADTEKIRKMFEYYPVSGVTTNPTILTKSGKKPYEVLREIRGIIGPETDLHVQTLGEDADEIVHEATVIKRMLGEKTFVKIPVTREGIKAIRICAQRFGHITGTAVYSTAQAYLAAEAGADYIAPYVNRIDDLSQNGVEVTKKIQNILGQYAGKTRMLAASFRNVHQVIELAEYGVYSATVDPDIIERMLTNDSVDAAIAKFSADMTSAYGEQMVMTHTD